MKLLGVVHRKREYRPSGQFLVREHSVVEDTFALVAKHDVVVDSTGIFNQDGKLDLIECHYDHSINIFMTRRWVNLSN